MMMKIRTGFSLLERLVRAEKRLGVMSQSSPQMGGRRMRNKAEFDLYAKWTLRHNQIEGLLRLKINLTKSRLFGIGVANEHVTNVASSLGCTHDKLPFIYLGLSVCKRMWFCDGWANIIDRFRSKLSAWKAKSLSISGRLTLIKSILGSLPIYYLSLFKAPSKVIIALESIRSGLGVGSILAKNLGLLGKWKWHFLTEKDALWRAVIQEFYGDDGGLEADSIPNSGGVWCDILKAISNIRDIDAPFKDSFSLNVSNGTGVEYDIWCYENADYIYLAQTINLWDVIVNVRSRRRALHQLGEKNHLLLLLPKTARIKWLANMGIRTRQSNVSRFGGNEDEIQEDENEDKLEILGFDEDDLWNRIGTLDVQRLGGWYILSGLLPHQSTDTLRLLTNEQKAFRDNLHKSGVGYNGSCVLSQAYAKIPKLYRAYELCDKNEQLHVFDSEETLEDAEKSQLKMNEFQKDEKNSRAKDSTNYEKLNKLYKDFVPQKERSVEQTYFLSSCISSVSKTSSDKFASKTKPSMASMPSANPMLVTLIQM
ncbi:hypothetical protein Tco_0270221, partial [Tanacetum coccineum]